MTVPSWIEAFVKYAPAVGMNTAMDWADRICGINGAARECAAVSGRKAFSSQIPQRETRLAPSRPVCCNTAEEADTAWRDRK